MSDPWAEFRVKPSAPSVAPTPAPSGEADPWAEFRQAKPEGPSKAYKGAILPFSVDEQGKGRFDSDAGLVGSIKRMVTTPGDVYTGKIDLNTDEGFGRALELGSAISPISPAARATSMGVTAANVKPPSSEALTKAGAEGFNRVRDMGVDYSTPAVTNMIQGVRAGLEKDGILAELAPKTHAILSKFNNPPDNSVVPISNLYAARRAADFAARDFTNPTEQAAAARLIEKLDDFVNAADPRSVVAGPAAAAAKESVTARGNYAAGKRSEFLQGIEERADLRAAAAGSGRNLDNTIRQRVADVVIDPRKSRGFTDAEIAELEQVVRGTPVRNTVRAVGNMLGGGGGLGAVVAGGGAGGLTGSATNAGLGALVGATVPLVGAVAKTAGNRMTERVLQAVDAATRARSPLYAQMKAAAPPAVNEMVGSQAAISAVSPSLQNLGNATPATPAQPIPREQLIEALRQLLREGGA